MHTLATDSLLDPQIVRELIGATSDSGSGFMRDLLATFTADARAALERMRRQVLMNDAAALACEAHRLKGSSGTMGAIRLAGACLSIERSARSGLCAGLEAHIDGALDVLDATRFGLDEFFRGTIAETV